MANQDRWENRWQRYCLYPGRLVDGNQATLLVDGTQAFSAMVDAISQAKQTILMDSYIFNDDQVGQIFSDVLCQKARSGIDVFLIVDGVGTVNVPGDFFEHMRHQGVNVLEYHPVAPWRKGFNLLRRNHRKLLVVDGRVGFAGGLNVGDEWLSPKAGGHGWHDIHVRIEGPVVRDLAKLSVATWQKHGKRDIATSRFLPRVPPVGNTLITVVGSKERRQRKAIRRSYYHAIKRAKSNIYIANAYFLPDRGFRRALKNAVKRGVDVRIMLPAKGDILPVQLASQALYGSLLRHGIRLFLWKDAVLHAKTAVIDGVWATVGSFNLDRRSWAMNLEVNINVLDWGFAKNLTDEFEADERRCEEMTREKWRNRPVIQRFLEKFFYLFRKFM